MTESEIFAKVASGLHYNPHEIFGPHFENDTSKNLIIRFGRKSAQKVSVLTKDKNDNIVKHNCKRTRGGIWQTSFLVEQQGVVPDYRLEIEENSYKFIMDDPYRHLPTLTDFDLHLLQNGNHNQLWKCLGSQVKKFGIKDNAPFGETVGTAFALWAPNAIAVSVIGDFNYWTFGEHAMRSLGASGIWELFIPGVQDGAKYKFEIVKANRRHVQKADPIAKCSEVSPATASIVYSEEYEWNDSKWLKKRAKTNAHTEPMSIYEVHLGSWKKGLTYRQLAIELVDYVKENEWTHVEFLPITQHPFAGSWGYQTTGYYAPYSALGTPTDLKFLIDKFHKNGIGVIMDWVPAHFPKDEFSLGEFDGTHLYEYYDKQKREHKDWGTYIFDYSKPQVTNFLKASACYWFEEFHIDGFRVDAVSSMVYLDYSRRNGEWSPNIYGGNENLEAIGFLKDLNSLVYNQYHGIVMIAEESTSFPDVTKPTYLGGLGFGLKWNMGWMHDMLVYSQNDPMFRHDNDNYLTFPLLYAFNEQWVLPFSHDEVVHGKKSMFNKMGGDDWKKYATLRVLYAYQWAFPGKKLLFMGNEIAQFSEWNSNESINWWQLENYNSQGLSKLVKDINFLYKIYSFCLKNDFNSSQFACRFDKENDIMMLIRYGNTPTEAFVAVFNFGGLPKDSYSLPLPLEGKWLEVLNTDSEYYGGSGVGNLGEVNAKKCKIDEYDYSAKVQIPPLAAIYLVPENFR